MATQQGEGGVPFSVAHDLRQFRLLELPAELLELLDSPTPPPLSIKSQAPPASSGTFNAKPAYAVLCTPSRTYQLRQVQTSNSVFITQATLEAHEDEIPVPTTCAIASCGATLELHPADTPALRYLEDVLPIYDIVDGEVDASGNGKSMADVFKDIPLSEGQCKQGWEEVFAFEFAGSSWMPSANTLLQVWTAVNDAAASESVPLHKQFLTDDIINALDDRGYPESLIQAILTRLGYDDQKDAGWSCLDRSRTMMFVGETLLEAKLASEDYLIAEFLGVWKDSVPELWREDVDLHTLEGRYNVPSDKTIRSSKRGAKTAPAASKASAGSSSRKWHEKFGRARKK
ncbi:sister chromatid cohesion protein-like protein Dcc1 [Lophiotrema nucula]|uniref:Sister chromatid cohesion protein-like protein Dcc1 n=1 Tax=Lophiotrema nucula TaxID=690887 RepID=A0A6A5ZPN5_9PLEO|nr:sister chromatid cohesion protein-like protein Dcc1 [Lophiotrema nucula]